MSKTDIPKGVINKSTVIRHDGKVASAQWSDLKAARQKYKENLMTYGFCKKSGNWHGYSEIVTKVNL